MPTVYFFIYYGGARFIVGFPDGFEVRGTPAGGVTIEVWNGTTQSKQADAAYGMQFFNVPSGEIYWSVPGYSGTLMVVEDTHFIAIDLNTGSTHIWPSSPPATTLSISLTQIPPIKPSTSLTFTGRLKRPDTGAFIGGQTIAVEHPPGTAVKTGVTDSSGTYGITITAPPTSGTYPYRTRFAGSSGLSASQSGTLGIGIEAPSLAVLAALGFLAYKILVK